jgi:hypothetical protein
MARSKAETRAASKQVADLDAVVQRGGAVTYRIAVNHADDDHDVAPVPFHFGPAFNDAYAQTVAEVLDSDPGDVNVREQAEKGLARAQAEYPESAGYECWLEVVYPADDGESHEIRRVG